MNKERLRHIVKEVVRVNPRGVEVLPKSGVFERVNVYFCTVDIYLALLPSHKDELEAFFRVRRKKFFSGPDHITFGRIIGDHELSCPLLAVGKTLGFWGLIVPKNPGDLLCMTDFQL